MNLNRLLNTSVIKLSFRYILLFALLVGVSLAVLYWSTTQYIDVQMAASLEQEIHDLQALERNEGFPKLQRTIQAWSNQPLDNQRYFLLVSTENIHLSGRLKRWPPGIKANGEAQNFSIEDDLIPDRAEDDDGYWSVIGVQFPGGEKLLIAENFIQAQSLKFFTLNVIVGIFFLTLILAFSMGLLLALSLLRRIDRVNSTAREIVDGNLGQRVPVGPDNDEFDDLATNLNAMLERIQELMLGMKQVSDNVAHDLRTPLTRIKNRLDIILLHTRSGAEYRDVIQQTIVDTNNLLRIFSALLQISQVEARTKKEQWGYFNLSALCEKIGSLYQDLAEVQNLDVTLNIEQNIFVRGEEDLIGQSISNLLENAVKYVSQNGHILLNLKKLAHYAQIEVQDNGPGIPASSREHVFGRFVRLDEARSTPGNGLGLSLVKAVAVLHSADLDLVDGDPGLKVVIKFPL